MIHTLKAGFVIALNWLLALNPDPVVKALAVLASVTTIAAGISTIIKNRKK